VLLREEEGGGGGVAFGFKRGYRGAIYNTRPLLRAPCTAPRTPLPTPAAQPAGEAGAAEAGRREQHAHDCPE